MSGLAHAEIVPVALTPGFFAQIAPARTGTNRRSIGIHNDMLSDFYIGYANSDPTAFTTMLAVPASDWTVSLGSANEYYYNTQIPLPLSIREDIASGLAADGTVLDFVANTELGSLAAGQWSFGIHASDVGVTTNRVYIRLSDTADPDTKAAHYIQRLNRVATLHEANSKLYWGPAESVPLQGIWGIQFSADILEVLIQEGT